MIFRRKTLTRLAVCLTAMLPLAAHAEGKSILILDASGSMWGQIDGRPKLEIAREALGSVLSALPADTELGLMAYGHREKGSCEDIELVVPPGKGTAGAITDAAKAMTFLGKTPLSDAVRRAASELRSTEEKATVILITDGIETCNADPCTLANELEAAGVDFTAHVVGFGLTEDEGRQVACLAENTGGKYIEAKDASSLTDALKTTVAAVEPTPEPAPAPEPPPPTALEQNFAPRVMWAAGGEALPEDSEGSVEVYARNADGSRGELVHQQYGLRPTLIEPGTYLVVFDRDEVEAEITATITADQMATPDIVLNAGMVHIIPVTEEGSEPVSSSSVTVEGMGRSIFHYGDKIRVVPVGDYQATVSIGKGTATQPVGVRPGETTTQEVIVSVGVAVLNTAYTADIDMDNIGQWIEVFAAKKALDGSRKSVAGGYGAGQEFTLPPGDYLAVAAKDEATGELAFTVTSNERTDVKVVLNAGVLAVTAPGARSIEVFSAKKAIDGSRKSVRFTYGEEINLTFPPGDYIIAAEHEGTTVEAPATVLAGERSEVAIAAP